MFTSPRRCGIIKIVFVMGWEDGGATAQSFKNVYVAKTFSISPPSMVRSYSESVYETKECICLWDTDLPILYRSDCFSFSTCSLRDVYAQPYLRCGVRYAIPFRRHGDHGAISDTLSLIMTQTFWSVCNILPLRNQLFPPCVLGFVRVTFGNFCFLGYDFVVCDRLCQYDIEKGR